MVQFHEPVVVCKVCGDHGHSKRSCLYTLALDTANISHEDTVFWGYVHPEDRPSSLGGDVWSDLGGDGNSDEEGDSSDDEDSSDAEDSSDYDSDRSGSEDTASQSPSTERHDPTSLLCLCNECVRPHIPSQH